MTLGYRIVVKPDSKWLDSKDRVYPVTVDPEIRLLVGYQSDITRKGINILYPYTLGRGDNVVSSTYSYQSIVQYYQFNLPELSKQDTATAAYFNQYMLESKNDCCVSAYVVTSEYDPATLSGTNRPSHDPKPLDANLLLYGYNKEYVWDITTAAKQWYQTGNCYGIFLTATPLDGSSYAFCKFSDSSLTLTIYYKNSKGLEPYWTYHSQSLGRAGTGYVNDCGGNLVFVHTDVAENGEMMPTTIKHIFNSFDTNSDIGYGLGWRLNINERVSSDQHCRPYVYTDEDGTIHHFTGYDNTDKANLGLTIFTTSDDEGNLLGTRITDKAGNGKGFAPCGLMVTQCNARGIYRMISYEDIYGTGYDYPYEVTQKPVKVTDGVGRETMLNYQNGKLTSILNASGRTIAYEYTGNLLTRITYPDNTYTVFTYDSNNNLTSVTANDGYRVEYLYTNGTHQKVQQVLEKNTDGTLGQVLSMSYDRNATTFTDVTGRTSTYKFNNYGNTVSMMDNEGNAIFCKYYTGSNTGNKLMLESKLQKTVLNYLKNHNAEVVDVWNAVSEEGNTGSAAYSGTYDHKYYMGKKSLRITKTNLQGGQYYSQQVNLERGKTYTLSGYIKTEGVASGSGKGAALFIRYRDVSGTVQEIATKYIDSTTDWQRYECKFTLPSDASNSTVDILAGIREATGQAYFDCLQMEDGPIANRYNLVENADFTYGSDTPLYWQKNGDFSSSDTITSSNDPDHPEPMDTMSFKVSGAINKPKKLTQVINVVGLKGDVFSIGAWAKGYSLPTSIHPGREFSIEVALRYGIHEKAKTKIQFDNQSNAWSYISDYIVADGSYDNIIVNISYVGNLGDVLFDGIQVYKESFGQSYTYDTAGNVTSITGYANQTSNYSYLYDDLISYISPKGNEYSMTYSYHDLLTKTTPEDVKITNTYNSFGNLTSTTIGEGSTFIKSQNTYTSNGKYLSTQTDPSGNTVTYNYNQTKGTLESFTDAKNTTTSYTYDSILDRLTEVSKMVGGQQVSNSYGYQNDRLSSITHNGFNYTFNYNSLGSLTQVLAAGQSLISNTYEARTGKLLGSTYGNGQDIGYQYDNLDRVTEKTYNGVTRYKYVYDANGNVGCYEDFVNNVNYRYLYDMADRAAVTTDSLGNSTGYKYDIENNLIKIIEKMGGDLYVTKYTYDKDNRLKKLTIPNLDFVSYMYDSLNRLTGKTINTGSATYNTTYSYKPGTNGSSTNLLDTINNNGNTISYTYDANGNIETITQNGNTIRYYYDELNQAIREDNQVLGKTITYSYDVGGNITSKIEYGYTIGIPSYPIRTYNYGYNDTAWKDKLTSFDGKTITYDAIGNPLTYDGWTYTWEEGRQLAGLSRAGITSTYKYNDSGIRTEKTVNGITTKYHLVGNNVTYESDNSQAGQSGIYYSYDTSGKLISMTMGEIPNLLAGTSEVGTFESGETSAAAWITTTNNLQTSEKIMAVRLAGDCPLWEYNEEEDWWYEVYTPEAALACSTPLNLEQNKRYVVEFDYWADKDNIPFSVDLYPDDLPQMNLTATKQLQHCRWEFESSSVNMQNAILRLSSDTVGIPQDIYYIDITNIRMYKLDDANNTYYYIRNGQGDIIGLIDNNGNQVVSYTYDTWGKVVSISGTLASTIGLRNPYRYRGYRYDEETGLYYLQSRYYNPEWGRFINADSYIGKKGDLLGHNLFAYCQNNPVNTYDPNGHFLIALPVVAIYGLYALCIGIMGYSIIQETINTVYATYEYLQQADSEVNDDDGRFKDKLKDVEENPEDWVKTGENTQPSTNKRNKGGESTEEEYTNINTGDKIFKHILKDQKGKIIEQHFRPYPKQMQ